MHILKVIIFLCIGYTLADRTVKDAYTDPIGPYYCQARCVASCLESQLAADVTGCGDYCPPFQDDMPCSPDDKDCWRNCGAPQQVLDKPSPQSVSLVPVVADEVQDPYLIKLAWTASENASIYIVEFYPLNRDPRPGEENFFRAVTTSLTYTVRKEDECIMYDARVIAVNSYGLSIPTYTLIDAPVPQVRPTDNLFSVRDVRREPFEGMVYVTIDYSFVNGWPTNDMDISDITFRATECNNPDETFASGLTEDGYLNDTSYTLMIGKQPTTAIVMLIPDDVVLSDCLIQMRVNTWTTRCNTSITFDDSDDAPSVNFRLNCDTVRGACDNDTSLEMQMVPPVDLPIPIPYETATATDGVVSIGVPGYIPDSVDSPDDVAFVEGASDVATTETTPPLEVDAAFIEGAAEATDDYYAIPPIPDEDTSFIEGAAETPETPETPVHSDNMPTPPPLPLFVIDPVDQAAEAVGAPPEPVPDISLTIVDIGDNGSRVQEVQIDPQSMPPPLCEMDMIDVQPSPSPISPSLIDLTVTWLERQPLPPPPPPTYFTIRYGPTIRQLVDDDRQLVDIIPGYETFVRTGQQEMSPMPDTTRQITISGVQRSSLLKMQICAIYDKNSEPFIPWDAVHSQRIDLAALEPFLEMENTPPEPPKTVQPPNTIPDTASPKEMPVDDAEVEVPLVIAVDTHHDHKMASAVHGLYIMGGLLLLVVLACMILLCVRRTNGNRRRVIKMVEKPVFMVNNQPTPPATDVVKIPLA